MRTILFLMIAVSLSVTAQTHRFIYDVTYKPDSASIELRKTNYYLDINPDETFYYERQFFVSDSIFKSSGLRTFAGKTSDLLSKNRKLNQYILYSIQNFEIYQLKDNPVISWNIEKETKMYASLQLQKATTNFGGRKWTAWFSKEFPFQEGPYKFHGLPGMIVEIYDDKKNYHFVLNKTENFDDIQFIDFYKNAKRRAAEIPYTKYQAMLLSYFNDPLKFLNSGQLEINENSKLLLDDGTSIYKPEDLRKYSIQEKERIKKYNNPIELDKAVKYPDIK